MGSSPSIGRLKQKEPAFNQYLESIKAIASQKVAELRTLVDADINKFYTEGGWDDRKPFIGGMNWDVQHSSGWSLDNLDKIIGAIGDAMLGRSKVPAGVDIKPENAGLAVDKLESLKLMTISKAFDTVASVLQKFTVSTSTTAKMDVRHSPLTPGLTMFVGVLEETYSRKEFFNGETILQYAVVYNVYSSLKQGGDMSKFNDLLAYEELKAAWRQRMADLAQNIADPSREFDQLQKLQVQYTFYEKRLDELTAKVNELQSNKMAAL